MARYLMVAATSALLAIWTGCAHKCDDSCERHARRTHHHESEAARMDNSGAVQSESGTYASSEEPRRNQDRRRVDGQGDRNLTAAQDEPFAREVSLGNLTEIELGQVALKSAGSDGVKRFAQRMIDDHGRAQNDLKSAARAERLEIPSKLEQHHRDRVSRLSGMSGQDFDREYVKMMVDDHQSTITKFEERAESGTDNEIRNFARKTLPTLREHLRMAQELQQQLK